VKFQIFRTSQGTDSDEAPVDGAVIEQRPRVDRRTVDDLSRLRFGRDTWYTHGTNHRVEGGCILRDMEMRSIWVIEIASLEALMTLVGDDEIVLGAGVIEIYDNYRE